MLRVAGVDHVIMLDIHSDIVQGFFDFPVDNLWIRPCMSVGVIERM